MKWPFLIRFNSEEGLALPWEVWDTNNHWVGSFRSYFEAREEAKKYAN